MTDDAPFLNRWSRLKQQAREPAPVAQDLPPAPAVVQTPAEQPPAPAKEPLPAVESITLDTDIRGFLRPDVDAGLKRAALGKLFQEPHFNIMDGLDVYIDDYGKPDPIPEAMMATLKLAHKALFAERKEEPASVVAEVEQGNMQQTATPEAQLEQVVQQPDS